MSRVIDLSVNTGNQNCCCKHECCFGFQVLAADLNLQLTMLCSGAAEHAVMCWKWEGRGSTDLKLGLT